MTLVGVAHLVFAFIAAMPPEVDEAAQAITAPLTL
jgi:hypothetical protein